MFDLVFHIICLILLCYSFVKGYINLEIVYAIMSLLFYMNYRFDKIEKNFDKLYKKE